MELQCPAIWNDAIQNLADRIMSREWSVQKGNGALLTTEDQVLTHWTRDSVKRGYRNLRLESWSCEIDHIQVGITFRKFVIALERTLPAELIWTGRLGLDRPLFREDASARVRDYCELFKQCLIKLAGKRHRHV